MLSRVRQRGTLAAALGDDDKCIPLPKVQLSVLAAAKPVSRLDDLVEDGSEPFAAYDGPQHVPDRRPLLTQPRELALQSFRPRQGTLIHPRNLRRFPARANSRPAPGVGGPDKPPLGARRGLGSGR